MQVTWCVDRPSIRAQLLEEGGPKMWEEFMAELREAHLGAPARRRRPGSLTVAARLRAAYEAVAAKRRKSERGRS